MSRDWVSALVSAVSNTRAVFLTASIVLSLSSAAWAQSPSAAHDGSCRVAIVHGQHVQPSPKCHLPPPLAQNPASIENTATAPREEIDRLATYLLRQSAASAEPLNNDAENLDAQPPQECSEKRAADQRMGQ